MASRSRSRRERDSDGADSLKPIVVLVLLGTIAYGAWSVVTKGPGGVPPDTYRADLAVAPPFASTPDLASALPAQAPPLAPPTVSAGPPAVAVAGTPPAGMPAASASPFAPPSAATDPAPTYLSAAPAPPPTAEPLPAEIAAARPPVAMPTAPPQAVDVGPTPRTLAAPGAPPTAVSRTAAFASAWTDAHEKLSAGRYAEALAVLSLWYDDAALGPEESQRLEDLLNQLAGTVIWSQQDLLLPPHVVAPGETLGTIAAPLGVPWQVLAKINGVADPVRLVPGESLKMLRGPFDGLVSVSRRRLSLQVNACYAGSFPVVVGRQIRDRVGGSLSVLAAAPPAAAADGAAQVAWAQPGPRSIPLSGGIVIEAVTDPTVVSEESVGPTSLVVSERDLAELADMLGAGSRVLIRQ